MLRQYHLTREDEDCYTLMFDNDGSMFVEVFRDFDQPYKKPRTTNLFPQDFGNHKVSNESLKDIVVRKLDEILPKTQANP